MVNGFLNWPVFTSCMVEHCGSRSDGFAKTHLIWNYCVFKMAYSGIAYVIYGNCSSCHPKSPRENSEDQGQTASEEAV